MSSPPNDATTLVHALLNNAKKHPKHVLLQWVNPQCEVDETITYEQLWERSGQVAAFLLENGIAQGDRVMIAYPFRLDFLSGLFGCMRIGAIACSVSQHDPLFPYPLSVHVLTSIVSNYRYTRPTSRISQRPSSRLSSSIIKLKMPAPSLLSQRESSNEGWCSQLLLGTRQTLSGWQRISSRRPKHQVYPMSNWKLVTQLSFNTHRAQLGLPRVSLSLTELQFTTSSQCRSTLVTLVPTKASAGFQPTTITPSFACTSFRV